VRLEWTANHSLLISGAKADFAFDLLRLKARLAPLPLEERRARLRKALRGASKAVRFSQHLEATARLNHSASLSTNAARPQRTFFIS